MRLKSFDISNVGPLVRVAVDDLADVVVLAGPNGIGKTNLMNAILGIARNPKNRTGSSLRIEATQESELGAWGKAELDTSVPEDAQRLRTSLARNRRRSKYEGSFLNFDSDRAITNVQSFNFSWDITDPTSEEIDWGTGFSRMSDRYNDVRHSLFRLVESQRREIAEDAIQQKAQGRLEMKLDFPDVLQPYKEAFWRLLAPKELVEVNARDQQIYYNHNGQRLPFDGLSSGEREVVNVVFDFILRGPQHSIIVFDEPELHLHPELSYRMLQTLSEVGVSNQFIFSTHSPEIISASLENTVVFITPTKGPGENQALVVGRDDSTQHALQTLGQSVGVISLGKKIVLVEGDEASLDKLTYGAILRNRFPEFVLVPVGGKGTLRSFDEVRQHVLDRTVWGVQFFLLADRDATSALGPTANSQLGARNLQQLPRYHLENYFLDAAVLSKAFESVEPDGSWLRDSVAIDGLLRDIARGLIPYATALSVSAMVREVVGNISVMPRALDATTTSGQLVDAMIARLKAEVQRIGAGADEGKLATEVQAEFARLESLVASPGNEWKVDIPGRPVLNMFAARAKLQTGRLKQLYLKAAEQIDPFTDIVSIFEDFRRQA